MEYLTYLSEEPVCSNDDFIIYGNDINFSLHLLDCLTIKKKELLSFFSLDEYPKTNVYIYDDKETFLKYTKQFFMPSDYCAGHFANRSVNLLKQTTSKDESKHLTNIINAAHEFVHLVYSDIVGTSFKERITWLDEGLAELFSGSYDQGNDMNDFLDKYVTGPSLEVPPITFLKNHGSNYGEFVDSKTKKYSGYRISYMMVRFLFETMNKKDFISYITSYDLVKETEQKILDDSINYYSNKKTKS